jgi:hypothetical protein
MNAHGWNLVQKTSASGSTPYRDAIAALNEENRALCSREDLNLFYSRSPCSAREATLEQLADHTKITSEEKSVLLKVRDEINAINAKRLAVHHQYNAQNFAAIAAHLEKMHIANDKLALEYYESRITRGEYNKRRLELATEAVAEGQRAIRGS